MDLGKRQEKQASCQAAILCPRDNAVLDRTSGFEVDYEGDEIHAGGPIPDMVIHRSTTSNDKEESRREGTFERNIFKTDKSYVGPGFDIALETCEGCYFRKPYGLLDMDLPSMIKINEDSTIFYHGQPVIKLKYWYDMMGLFPLEIPSWFDESFDFMQTKDDITAARPPWTPISDIPDPQTPEDQVALLRSMSKQSLLQMAEPIYDYRSGHEPLDDTFFICVLCFQLFYGHRNMKRNKKWRIADLEVKHSRCSDRSCRWSENLERHIFAGGSCGKGSRNKGEIIWKDPMLVARPDKSLENELYPTHLETKLMRPRGLQMGNIYSSNLEDSAGESYERHSPSCDQERISLDVELETMTPRKDCNLIFARSQVNSSSPPPSPAISSNSDFRSSTFLVSPSSRANTLSPITNDDTDWSEEEYAENLHFPGFFAISKEALHSREQTGEMMERIMKEFWAVFEQQIRSVDCCNPVTLSAGSEASSSDTPCEGGEVSSKNSGFASVTETFETSQDSTPRDSAGRKRGALDHEDYNNGDERSPKRPRRALSQPEIEDVNAKYACPYRKQNPRKYSIQHWRPCALTPLETVARVKGHLYRHHRIFLCQRCKNCFKDQESVTMHLNEPEPCEVRNFECTDGVTTEIVEKLRSKKRVQRDQSEADRWKDIYKLLFPNETIPSPYFEAVQEDLTLSPDERALADYEEYCRQELPRVFRTALEEIVHEESQLIEERIRNRLLNIIQDCQDRVFSSYRTSISAIGTPSKRTENAQSSTLGSLVSVLDISIRSREASLVSSRTLPPAFLQPHSPQTHLQPRLVVSDLPSSTSKAPEGNISSDSGYGSNCLGRYSSVSSSSQNTSDSACQTSSNLYISLEPAPAAEELENNLDGHGDNLSDSGDTLTCALSDLLFQYVEPAKSTWNII